MVHMRTRTEKNMDDFVYEDAYYEEVLQNNESIDDPGQDASEAYDALDNQDDLPVQMIIVCEDCTHQWEDVAAVSEESHFCPMCGSDNVVII